MFSLWHIPGLFVASTQTFGGMASFFNSEWCIEAYGLPARFSRSPEAQIMMIVSSARMSAFGIAMFIFHLRGQYELVDTMLMILGSYVGAVDAYVAWYAGVKERITFRLLPGGGIALLGAWGVHGRGA